MHIQDFVDIAEEFANLGWAVQEQFKDVMNGEIHKCNPNALRAMRPMLRLLRNAGVDGVDDVIERLESNENDD